MKIFSGKNSLELTKRIIKFLNVELQKNSSFVIGDNEITLGKLKIDYFSDGEILPLFEESVRDQDVFLVQSTTSSDTIMETLLTIDAAKRAGCRSFTLVAPFQGYSRQDKTDHLRSSIGSKMLADILEKSGMSRIITIDLHASAIQGFYNVPVIHLNGNKIFIDYIRENSIEDLTILAPDQGAVKRASDFCKGFPEATFAMINKKRIKPNEIHSMELVGDVSGRNVIIVDDLVDTGGTLKKAADLIMKSGAKSVRCVATHGVLSGKAYENLEDSQILEVLVSDSIPYKNVRPLPEKIKYISCAKLIAKSIWSISQHKSIHEINLI
jgi:ribose-phosphate pyrophosphokinase